jgi:hypothetical protein
MRLPFLALFACSLAGCTTLNHKAATEACADFANVYCQKQSSCSGGTEVTRAYGDPDTCVSRQELSCMLTVDAKDSGKTPDAIEACVAAYATYSCFDFFADVSPDACVYTGTRQLNEPCAFPAQCASTYCNNNKTSSCGTCGEAPAVGSSCVNSSCARGQDCVARSQTCEVEGTVGDPCDNDMHICGADLACLGSTTTTEGTCTNAINTVGAACSTTLGECDGTYGLTCEGTSGARTCQVEAFGADGAACGSLANDDFASCSGGGACYTSTGIALAGQMGACKAPAADGAACDTVLGPGCLTPARCLVTGGDTTGVCTLPSASTCE